ncbi:B-cell CLL/lymphoma 6 member B protein-like isoform X5 [Microplitis mediator]|uniref:B-cell CLL/lymphoma 6 member B protein-like isoform X5 n=1 Tax=Microplitis mediator TaxID=375433 RepID=UPI00255492BB|nr:B-cell CLL/lymphoma 6 member B protein-like isoform X5 [Microplitis mediator]
MGDDDQQFCLRWNNHQTTLIQNFDTLLESGTLVDCTLAAEGKYLKAHKVVLSACSPYFEGLLSEHYDKHPVFILKDVKFKELKAMMDYMYRGEVNISQDQLAALLKAAESLQIKGLSESKTGSGGNTSGSSKAETRSQKTAPQPTAPSLDIPHSSSGLTIEKNSKVPRQSLAQTSVGDLPEDSASPSLSKGISSREGSVSPNGRKRKRYRRRSLNDDNPIDNHETSNSSDMSHQPMNVPAPGVAPIADEKSMSESADSLGRSALMQQLTKPADEMLQMPVEKPEPNDTLIEPKSEYLEDPEESVEDLTLDDDFNDTNDLEPDNNRAGPSHDSSHPGHASWHVTGDRSNAGGVVGSVAGAPGSNDEVFMAAQEAANAHRDSQDYEETCIRIGDVKYACSNENCDRVFTSKDSRYIHTKYHCGKPPRFKCPHCNYRSLKKQNIQAHAKRLHFDDDTRVIELYKASTSGAEGQDPNDGFEAFETFPMLEIIPKIEPDLIDVKPQPQQLDIKPRIRVKSNIEIKSEINVSTVSGVGIFSCPNLNCGRTFKNIASRNRHLKKICNQKPNFKCSRCEFKALLRETVEDHAKKMHRRCKTSVIGLINPVAGELICPNENCQKVYASRKRLEHHVKYDCKKLLPRFKCYYCQFKAFFKSQVKKHVIRNHPSLECRLINLISDD